ncbi:hypothetical protein F991_01380 [Acinetobacter sp. CIP-A165]|uniref:hypothetical protein n=1 Tax=Acinetobacter sp. CIP-A165 TaxID=40373 RepID=UPI0002D09C12|nr:hypothetical protein [Acinetobacter sp. CIP-A165]ENU30694.1 hypothetical protein F991_01380 [Acinetobacter sp. CIP-A165]
MIVPVILFPVVAFGLAIGIGRVGTIVKDAMRVDFTTEMDDSHERLCCTNLSVKGFSAI